MAAATAHVDPKLLARRRLATLRRRVRRIRVRIACIAAVVFLAFFTTIYVQMARGLDPTLGSGTTKHASTTTRSTTTRSTTTRSTPVTAAAATEDETQPPATTRYSYSAPQPSSVTTQQS